MTCLHSLYGLNVSLPFPCALLPPVESDAVPDVAVTFGPVPKRLDGAEASDETWKMGYCWQAVPGRFLLRGGARSGRYLVENGDRITVHRNELADDERFLFLFLHPVAAALFRQRGFLVLHASSAATEAGAMVLCGRSRAGKSTTLAAMIRHGHGMISDDVTVLRRVGNGDVEVVPGPTMMHLWDGVAQSVGLALPEHGRHPMRLGKTAVTVSGTSSSKPVPLRRICIVEPDAGKKVRSVKLLGAEKIDALMSCIYGPFLREEHPGMFELISTTAERTDIVRILRPEGRWTVDEVIKVVLGG